MSPFSQLRLKTNTWRCSFLAMRLVLGLSCAGLCFLSVWFWVQALPAFERSEKGLTMFCLASGVFCYWIAEHLFQKMFSSKRQ